MWVQMGAGREGAAWWQPVKTPGVRAGARIRAQSPRPGGTAAAARARISGGRSTRSGGGCRTGDVKAAASAAGR